jgi:hypothetical protein
LPNDPAAFLLQAPLNPQLFEGRDIVAVRGVELRPSDDVQTHREKLARILLDEMFQFVGLLDARGTLIDVNRNALEGAGIALDRTLGLPSGRRAGGRSRARRRRG